MPPEASSTGPDPTTPGAPAPAPAGGAPPSGVRYPERIAVEMRGKVQSIPVDQIDYIVQSGPYAELHSAGRRHLIRDRRS